MRGTRRKTNGRSAPRAARALPRRTAQTVAAERPRAASPEPPATPADAAVAARGRDVFREIDRMYHAALSGAVLGISPASLAGAWQDWALHLAMSPGKQAELAL